MKDDRERIEIAKEQYSWEGEFSALQNMQGGLCEVIDREVEIANL
jgi:hypothetical protein